MQSNGAAVLDTKYRLSDSVALPVPAQQRAVVLEDSADIKSLVWASFVVLQSETNDQLDKERQLSI